MFSRRHLCCWSNAVEKGERERGWEPRGEGHIFRTVEMHPWVTWPLEGKQNICTDSSHCRLSKQMSQTAPLLSLQDANSCAEGWICNNFNRCLLEMKQNGFFLFCRNAVAEKKTRYSVNQWERRKKALIEVISAKKRHLITTKSAGQRLPISKIYAAQWLRISRVIWTSTLQSPVHPSLG